MAYASGPVGRAAPDGLDPRARATLAGAAARALVALLAVYALVFALMHALPGDPADALGAPGLDSDDVARTRRALGLDRPLTEQFARTVWALARGDLGVSFSRGEPVSGVLAAALPHTLLLGAAGLGIAYLGGIPLAFCLVLGPRGWRRAADRLLLAGATLPRFWLGVMGVLVLSTWTGLLPPSHATDPGGGDPLDRLRHLVLPAACLGLPAACRIARFLGAAMAGALASARVRLARAAGLPPRVVLARHALRPAAGPLLMLFALDLPALVSGALVVEVVFSWPGLGRVAARAILAHDYPLALGTALLAAVAVVAAQAAADLLLPRIAPAASGQGV